MEQNLNLNIWYIKVWALKIMIDYKIYYKNLFPFSKKESPAVTGASVFALSSQFICLLQPSTGT